jgi:hypothetical protein
MKRALIVLSLFLSGCINLGTDAEMSCWAQEEWKGIAPSWAHHVNVTAERAISISPSIRGIVGHPESFRDRLIFSMPWPCYHNETLVRATMRYEMSQALTQYWLVRTLGPWCPLTLVGRVASVLHAQEPYSWYCVLKGSP